MHNVDIFKFPFLHIVSGRVLFLSPLQGTGLDLWAWIPIISINFSCSKTITIYSNVYDPRVTLSDVPLKIQFNTGRPPKEMGPFMVLV